MHWISVDSFYNVYLSDACFDKIKLLANKHYPKEVGSSLIGRYSEDGFNAYIMDVGPIPSDSSATTTSFNRGIKGLKDFFDSLRSKFGYSMHYIGEWHSHPNGRPFPSGTDNKNQFAISRDSSANCPESVLLIIGDKFEKVGDIGMFVYSNKNGKIILNYK